MIFRNEDRDGVHRRFMEKVFPEPNSGCWLWGGCAGGGGRYGALGINRPSMGRYWMISAHRISYELFVGEIPSDMCVLHSCDVGFCVNPDHLRLGTQKENAADRHSRGRANTLRGEAHGLSKLDENDVRAIRQDQRAHKAIAKSYAVSRSLISQVKSHQIWTHIK